MFSSLLSAPCELKLHLLQNAVFLRPPTAANNEDTLPTSTDEVVRGMVELFVPHDRKIGGIRVKLRAVQSVAIVPDQPEVINYAGMNPIAWEDTILMEKVVDIGLPSSKSHATVPGDDINHSGERRGRSRAARSRTGTPTTSRPASPQSNAPPGYIEQEPASQASHTTGLGSAIVRAMSRSSRADGSRSRPSSQQASRSTSRAASRNPSPEREQASSPSNLHTSPSLEVDPTSPSTSRRSSLNRRISTVSTVTVPSPGEDYDVSPLAATLSRTGLSNGGSSALGPHPHISDREDRYGLIPPVPTVRTRGRGGAGSESSSAAAARSITMSPSRAFGNRRGRDDSKNRLMSMGRKGPRAPSVDAVATTSTSTQQSTWSGEGAGLDLQKGVHGFEFAFILPADSPPFERSPYGRVRYLIKATAFGAGRAKSNLEAWRDLFPVVNPSSEGGPTPLSILYSDMHPTVGLISIACTSNNISVGGIFNVDIHSPTPPTDLIVYLVRVSIETSVELLSRKKGKQRIPTQRHKLFEKGWVPPRPNDPHGPGDGKKAEGLVRDPFKPGCRSDDAWTVQGVARMPNDNVVRASTVARTRAAIRFSHSLLIEVVHSREAEKSDAERKLKVFALRQPITLPSCCVAYDAVSLPAYTADYNGDRPAAMPYDLASGGRQGITHNGPSGRESASRGRRSDSQPRSLSSTGRWANTAAPYNGNGHEFCVCGQSIQDLSERERNLMPAMPHNNLPLDGLSHRKIGELPERGERMGGSSLRRSTSRSSSTSSSSRANHRSSSSITRSLSRVRSSSSSRQRAASVQRPHLGLGDRGEGTIRTMSRGSRAGELPGEAQGHHHSSIHPPPAYGDVVEDAREDEADDTNDNLYHQTNSSSRPPSPTTTVTT